MRYDLVVIGGDPAGRAGAIAAATLGKRAAIIERSQFEASGECPTPETSGSQALREAILHATSLRRGDANGDPNDDFRARTMQNLTRHVACVVERERHAIREQLDRNGVDVYRGDARFTGPHELIVDSGQVPINLSAGRFLLACGTRPARPTRIPFDGRRVCDSDGIFQLDKIPQSLIVVGGGVIGLEYATLFATLGASVTVVDGRERLLDFCDREFVDMLMFQGRSLGIVFRLGEDVIGVDHLPGDRVAVQLESGKRLIGDHVLYAAGRIGDTAGLNLQAAGLEPDERGRLWCNENHRTWAPHIYGAGDVVGFPTLAGMSLEAGRRAVCHAFGRALQGSQILPFVVNTYPRIAIVGKNEDQLKKERVPHEIGVAGFCDNSRSWIGGDALGLVKILFHRATRKLLGVHCIGEAATECIHRGHGIMARDGTVDEFRDTVFDDPAVAERCKVATIDGLSKLALTANADRMNDLERAVAADDRERPEAATRMTAV